MERRDFVLAALSIAGEGQLSPVQLQKLFFLLDKLVTPEIGGPFFAFEPYNYGPFDQQVYRAVEGLMSEGLAEVVPSPGQSWSYYKLTQEGVNCGRGFFIELPETEKTNIERLVTFVRSLTFDQLVSSIYQAFPEMKVNSVFRG